MLLATAASGPRHPLAQSARKLHVNQTEVILKSLELAEVHSFLVAQRVLEICFRGFGLSGVLAADGTARVGVHELFVLRRLLNLQCSFITSIVSSCFFVSIPSK